MSEIDVARIAQRIRLEALPKIGEKVRLTRTSGALKEGTIGIVYSIREQGSETTLGCAWEGWTSGNKQNHSFAPDPATGWWVYASDTESVKNNE